MTLLGGAASARGWYRPHQERWCLWVPAFAGTTWRDLLLCQRQRELAVADAAGEAFDEFRHRVLAVGADQLGKRGEQARLRETIAVDAVVPGFRPSLVEIAERGLLLFVIWQRVAGERWMAHETQQFCMCAPLRSAL